MIYGTPTMFVDLINRQQLRKLDIHPEIAVTGGAPSSAQLCREMKKHLGVRKVKVFNNIFEKHGFTTYLCGVFSPYMD